MPASYFCSFFNVFRRPYAALDSAHTLRGEDYSSILQEKRDLLNQLSNPNRLSPPVLTGSSEASEVTLIEPNASAAWLTNKE
jgi:hypothetical protein